MLCKIVESSLWGAADVETWFRTLSDSGMRHGFDYTIFTLSANDILPFSGAFYKSNHSPVWRRIYEQKHYDQIDPVIRHCRTQLRPLVWGRDDFSTAEEQSLYEQAHGFGMKCGVALPIHGPKREVGMLCFATSAKSDEVRQQMASYLPELGMIRDVAYETGLRYAVQNSSAVLPKLTPREKECLKWICFGKSTWEMSRILSCSESTVNYHITNIRNKLGVHTRSAAMIKAVGMGLIEV
jgi:LuxR family quorum-sensing transcriptional regulator LasR